MYVGSLIIYASEHFSNISHGGGAKDPFACVGTSHVPNLAKHLFNCGTKTKQFKFGM